MGTTSCVVLSGDFTEIGEGGALTNGQVVTVKPQGNVLTTVTKDMAVSISADGKIKVIRLQHP